MSRPGQQASPRTVRWVAVAMVAALTIVASVVTMTRTTRPAEALENGVARTPPMGWNTWNTFGCNINETLIRQMADAIVANGMRELGYRYVVVDDCWFDPNRYYIRRSFGSGSPRRR